MIISASRRTDIPAYYAPWLMGRIAAGYCLVRNPFNAKSLRRVSLDPADLDFLVLWTRDPRPLAPYISEIEGRGIRFYVQMTLTGYPRALEPGAPPLDDAIDALCDLADRIGSGRLLWRYDPVILAGDLDANYHMRAFERIAAALEGRTKRVTLSVIDEYSGTRTRIKRAGFPEPSFESGDYLPLLGELAAVARSRGMRPQACAEGTDMTSLGIEPGACVDAELAASLWNIGKYDVLAVGKGHAAAKGAPKDPGQRGACRCAPSVDIGAYGTCPRGCAYCYANRGSGKLAARGPEDESL